MAYRLRERSEEQKKLAFWGKETVWVRRGNCRWIPQYEDKNYEGKMYPLTDKVRIGDFSWKRVPLISLPLKEKEKLWQKFCDEDIEKRLNSMPSFLHLTPILKEIHFNLLQVCILLKK